MTDRPLLRVVGPTKRYGDQLALAEFGFGLRTGEVVGLIGPNGAGARSSPLRKIWRNACATHGLEVAVAGVVHHLLVAGAGHRPR